MKNKVLKKWYENRGADQDIVLSSRIRLARNLKAYPFPGNMPRDAQDKVVRLCREASKEKAFPVQECSFLDFENTTNEQRQYMTEKHLISPDFEKSGDHTALILSPDESLSIMINEEDHIRIQMISPGMELSNTYKVASEVDDFLNQKLSFAFHKKFGFLTACPSNLGTGLRASVMLHLPVTAGSGAFAAIEDMTAKSGLVIRGIYGEGSRPEGGYYQVSNQFTLGCTEKDAIDKLSGVVLKIIETERTLRKNLYEHEGVNLEDKVFRALGILKNARILSSSECASNLSLVRIGLSLGILEKIPYELLNELIITSGPGNLKIRYGENLSTNDLSFYRAAYIREKLNLE